MFISEVHEFHFIISQSMKESLENSNCFKKPLSLSRIIVKVLECLAPVIKREYIWGDQRMSQYIPVSKNPVERRMHVHAYLPHDLYRELKLLHHDLNVFSIAQIIRELLDSFLVLVKEYGDSLFKELENMYQIWEKEANATRLTLSQYLRQLYTIIQHLPEKNRILTLYDNHFSPFWKLRL